MDVTDNLLIDPALINSIGGLLIREQKTIAAAEGVTSGLVQAVLSQGIDASKFYQGGISAYNIGQKYKHLNVEPIHASNYDCVTQKVADDMALSCCSYFKSDWGLGITGYASVIPGKKNKLVAYYAIATGNEIKVRNLLTAQEDAPYRVQLFYMR